MKKIISLTSIIFLIPFLVLAQGTIPDYLKDFQTFFNYLVGVLVVIAFFVFIINILRYFIIESTNEAGREKARALAMYGILAFFIIVAMWGIINLFTGVLGINGTTTPPASDYVTAPSGGSGPSACPNVDPILDCICNGGNPTTCRNNGGGTLPF